MFKDWQHCLLKTTSTFLLFGIIQGCSNQNALAECVPANFPANWLQNQEQLGGHTIARHVGKSDQQLVNRLNNDDRIRSSSSYSDLKTASNSIQSALRNNRDHINVWANNAPVGEKKVIDFDANNTVGRVATRPASINNVSNSNHIRIVLKATAEDSCFVLTSYPTE